MGHLYRFTSAPIGYPAPFAAEQDMETFLVEHMSLMGEHLGSGDSEADVLKTWRQLHLPRRGSAGRLDIVFVVRHAGQPVLYLAELKNEPIGKGAVGQITAYLEAWRRDANAKNRTQIADWLLRDESPVTAEEAERVALDVQGILVAPSYTADGIEAVVDWAKAHGDMPVQALKLLRFRATDGEGHVVLVDDVFIKPRRGQRIMLRWADLARHNLVTEETLFVMECGGRTIEAMPDFVAGRGKNLVPLPEHRKALLDALGTTLDQVQDDWIGGKVREVARLLTARESVPMSPLSLYVQCAFGGAKEPDWQRPAHLWRVRAEDGKGPFVWELDAKLR